MIIVILVFFAFCIDINYARKFPQYVNKENKIELNYIEIAYIIAKLFLIVAVLWVCWMFSLRRSVRPVKSNTLHAEMVTDVLAFKKYASKSKQSARRVKAKENHSYVGNKRQVLLNETRLQQAAHKAKLKERSAEESVLPPPTRDVKRFVESMADECEMEACTVRRTM